jgi:hypothetical protein
VSQPRPLRIKIDEVIADRYCQIGLEIRAAWSAGPGDRIEETADVTGFVLTIRDLEGEAVDDE